MQHDFEIYGTKGAFVFTQERFNELQFYCAADPQGRRGFRRIEASPDHPPYGRFCVANWSRSKGKARQERIGARPTDRVK